MISAETQVILNTLKQQQQNEIINSFKLLREAIDQRKVYVLFEDALHCDPATDHLKPKSVLPLFSVAFDSAETRLLQTLFGESQDAIPSLLEAELQHQSDALRESEQKCANLAGLLQSTEYTVEIMEQNILHLASEKGTEKTSFLSEIQRLKEQLGQKKSNILEYQPDFEQPIAGIAKNEISISFQNNDLIQERDEAIKMQNRLKNELTVLQIQFEKLKQHARELELQIADKEAIISRCKLLEEEGQERDSLVADLQSANAEYRRQVLALEEKNSALSEVIEQLNGQIAEFEANQQQLANEENERLNREIARMELEQQAQQQILGNTQQELNKLNELYCASEQKNKALSYEQQELTSQNKRFTEDIQRQGEQIQALKAEIETLQERLADAPTQSEDEKLQEKLRQMELQKEKMIEEQFRKITKVESDAFELITHIKAEQGDTAEQLVDRYQKLLQKEREDQERQSEINKKLNKIKSVSNSESFDDISLQELTTPRNQQSFESLLAKCHIKIEEAFKQNEQKIETLESTISDQLKQIADLNAVIEKMQEDSAILESQLSQAQLQNALLSTSSNAANDSSLKDSADSDEMIRQSLVELESELQEENEKIERATQERELSDEEIEQLTLVEEGIIKEFNEKLNELARLDVGKIESMLNEVKRASLSSNEENLLLSDVNYANRPQQVNKQTQTDAKFGVSNNTPKMTARSRYSGSDKNCNVYEVERKLKQGEKHPDDLSKQVTTSQLRTSMLEKSNDVTCELFEEKKVEETTGEGYGANGNKILFPIFERKWSNERNLINKLLKQFNISPIGANEDFEKALVAKKKEVEQYYNLEQIKYDRDLVIKALKERDNESMMIISTVGEKKYFAMMGDTLVRTIKNKSFERAPTATSEYFTSKESELEYKPNREEQEVSSSLPIIESFK